MITYLVGDKKYVFSYSELKEEYLKHLDMTDEEFLKNLPSALHIASFICFVKEIPTYICLADDGIIHELIHLLQHGADELIVLKDIRKLFEKQLKLN